jgi:hypothetical protein
MLEVLWVLVEMDPVAVSSCPAEQQSNTSLYLKKKKKSKKEKEKKTDCCSNSRCYEF